MTDKIINFNAEREKMSKKSSWKYMRQPRIIGRSNNMSWFSDGEKVDNWYLLHSGDADPEDFISPYERVEYDYTEENEEMLNGK